MNATADDHLPNAAASARKGTGRSLTLFVMILAIALAAGFVLVRERRNREAADLAQATQEDASAPPLVDVVTTKPVSAAQQLVLPGETAAWYESKIYARVSGYLAKWFVDIGDSVKKDQVLAVIETPETDAQLVAARAKLVASNAQVQVKQAEADFAKSTYDRWRESPQGVVSEQEREAKKAAYIGATAQLAAAKAQVALDQAEVDRLTALTAFKDVKAPFDGVIVQRDIDIGDLVTAGSGSNTSALFQISLDNPIRVFVQVPQAAATQLLKGAAKAVITVGDGSGRSYEGTVTRTSKAIDPRARTLNVEVDIPNADGSLVRGMYVQVAFSLEAGKGVQIPAAALLFRPGPQVAVIDKGTVSFRDVEIGADNGSVVEIKSGLQEGEKVGLNLSSQIAQGEKVTVEDADGGSAPRNLASK